MEYRRLIEWALGDSTGMSAKCIARHMVGLPTDGSYPHDGGDFGRCEKLLDACPEFRERLPEMAKVNPYWAALVPRWGEIRAASDKYELIKSITLPVEKQDRSVVRLSENVSIRF